MITIWRYCPEYITPLNPHGPTLRLTAPSKHQHKLFLTTPNPPRSKEPRLSSRISGPAIKRPNSPLSQYICGNLNSPELLFLRIPHSPDFQYKNPQLLRRWIFNTPLPRSSNQGSAATMRLSLFTLTASLALTSAHATWQQLWVNGVDQAQRCVYLPPNNNPITNVNSNVPPPLPVS